MILEILVLRIGFGWQIYGAVMGLDEVLVIRMARRGVVLYLA